MKKNNYDESEIVDPVTNNIRRIFRERGFPTQKAMALFLEEKPIVFNHYIWCGKRQIPSYDKLKKWAAILGIDVTEFFVIREEEQWPYRPKKEKDPRKPGIGYRMSLQIREEIIEFLPLGTILSHVGLSYLYKKYNVTDEASDKSAEFKGFDTISMAAESENYELYGINRSTLSPDDDES